MDRQRAQNFLTLRLTAELIRLLQRFSSEEIAALVVKGPVLAVRAYGDPARRGYGDLDLLVRQRDIRRATELMMAAGYQAAVPLSAIDAGKIPGQYLFSKPDSKLLVELHNDLTLRYFPRPLPIEEFFARLKKQNPDPKTELKYKNPYTLLVAVALSAQATDKSVNKATEPLFKTVDTPEKMVALGEAKLADAIKTIGLYRGKAKNVIALSKALIALGRGPLSVARAYQALDDPTCGGVVVFVGRVRPDPTARGRVDRGGPGVRDAGPHDRRAGVVPARCGDGLLLLRALP